MINLVKHTILSGHGGHRSASGAVPWRSATNHKRPAAVDVGGDTCWRVYLRGSSGSGSGRALFVTRSEKMTTRITEQLRHLEPVASRLTPQKGPHEHRKTAELIARPSICGLNDRNIQQQSSEQDNTKRIPPSRKRIIVSLVVTRHCLSTAVGRADDHEELALRRRDGLGELLQRRETDDIPSRLLQTPGPPGRTVCRVNEYMRE